jgi:hypothetical protein
MRTLLLSLQVTALYFNYRLPLPSHTVSPSFAPSVTCGDECFVTAGLDR